MKDVSVSSTKTATKAKELLNQFARDETLLDLTLPAQPVFILEQLKRTLTRLEQRWQ